MVVVTLVCTRISPLTKLLPFIVRTLVVSSVVPPVVPILMAVIGTFGGTTIAVSTVLTLLSIPVSYGTLTIGSAAEVVSILFRRVVTLVVVRTMLKLPLWVSLVKVTVLPGAWRVSTIRILALTSSLCSRPTVGVIIGRLSLEFTTIVIPPTKSLLARGGVLGVVLGTVSTPLPTPWSPHVTRGVPLTEKHKN